MAICVVCSRCIKEASVAGVEAAKVKDEVRGLKAGGTDHVGPMGLSCLSQ